MHDSPKVILGNGDRSSKGVKERIVSWRIGTVDREHAVPLSETGCDGKVDGTLGEVFNSADVARNISIEKAVVEAGEESWGEAV